MNLSKVNIFGRFFVILYHHFLLEYFISNYEIILLKDKFKIFTKYIAFILIVKKLTFSFVQLSSFNWFSDWILSDLYKAEKNCLNVCGIVSKSLNKCSYVFIRLNSFYFQNLHLSEVQKHFMKPF